MTFCSYSSHLYRLAEIFDFCAVYFVTLLGRCAAFSLLTLGGVLALRQAVRKNAPFAKGALWTAFLPILFLGKLRVYYQSRLFLPLILWQSWCSAYWWIRYGYLLGIAVSFSAPLRRRAKLGGILRHMESVKMDGQRIYLCDAPVSPFAAGILFPKIILPKAAWKRLAREDLRLILLHEQTHIRLGHLWYFLLWDTLCALLWVNPLLRLSTPMLREDMEHICDAVAIRKSGRDAAAYGRVILKSLALLKEEAAYLPAAFSGERAFDQAKRRFCMIRDYRPYSQLRAAALALCAMAALFASLILIQSNSMPPYTELTGFIIYQIRQDVAFVTMYQSDENDLLPLSWDGDRAEIDNRAFRALLPENAPTDGLYGILWGGFLKVPGIGGALNAVYFDGVSSDEITSAAFCNVNDLFCVRLMKWI